MFKCHQITFEEVFKISEGARAVSVSVCVSVSA